MKAAIFKEMISPKAFQLAAGKIDKISGDIRTCFEIIRSAIQSKLDKLSSISSSQMASIKQIQLGYDDVN